MKAFEKIIEILFLITTVVFVLAVVALIVGQAVAVITVNGEMAVNLSNLIAKPASTVSAVTTILCMILGYIRGQMKAED